MVEEPATVFGNFYLGTGSTEQQQSSEWLCQGYPQRAIALGGQSVQPSHRCLLGSYGERRLGSTRGFGVYNNWLTQANVQEEFRGSPRGKWRPRLSRAEPHRHKLQSLSLGLAASRPLDLRSRLFGPGTGVTPQSGGGLNAQAGSSAPALQLVVSIRS